MVRVNLIQTVRIWVLLRALREAVMRIQKITNFQASPTLLLILLLNGKAFGKKYGQKEVQNQRTHMPIKNFLIKTTFLCQNFLKKKSGLPPPKGTAGTSFTEGKIPEAPTQENILSEEDKEKVLEKAEKDIKKYGRMQKQKFFGAKKDQLQACQSFQVKIRVKCLFTLRREEQ